MPNAKLKTALAAYGHTRSLMDGTVRPRTFDFDFQEIPTIVQAFRRMVRSLEYDISELAITTYVCARAQGRRFTAIPVFPMRGLHHGAVLCNTRSGIRTPKDLEGKRVGVNRGYTVTTGLWARSILQHEYGVDLSRITWVLSGDEHVAEYQPPANVVAIDPGKTLEELLLSGEIAAVVGSAKVDSPDVWPLIPNAHEAGMKALHERGLYPINHTVVVRDDLLAARPDLAEDIFQAFVGAKQLYLERLREGSVEEPTAVDKLYRDVMDATGDPLPYGIEPNREMLEAVVRHSVEQGILSAPVAIDELFAPATRRLTG